MVSYARRSGTCALCQTPFHVGEEISFVHREGKNRPVCANGKTCEQVRCKRVAETPAAPPAQSQNQKNEMKPAPSPVFAPTLRAGTLSGPSDPRPTPTPPAPSSPPAPVREPTPGVAVSVVRTGEERAWSLLQVTYNLGGFESVKAGVADYARDGEDAQALAQRVAGLVYSELEAQVQALRSLHVRVETQTGEVSA